MTKKKTPCSAALSYTLGSSAPIIVAKGKGQIAEKILEIADKHSVPIIQDTILAEILSEQQIGACIPDETYQAVAAIFAFLAKQSSSYAKENFLAGLYKKTEYHH
ncbi:flagellar biosynthesis protein FlhB [Treponema phagedenis]|uniref:Flagellar biosynthesis protein FlhB n=1 Tax=Treponema phagedenis TaxID=162 RepID=A0A0B7GW68_TREPH|nr:EscU/YscU/HrcU family type III secretion system export apparatus switch protein [Treponema phagedenis]EFW38111.1 putative FlhB domain protein [Treponema phagedenis F0421]NVP23440.1 EscU/YscU/HrcU family type III secretion system export apparatus switch protein [Treponema phagedenis]QEJ95656.1 flagellar biosynthesis protein FlhB [Treponema phagedenis]QEJ98581.1 flagellar biosynthesis protein FlhB [Treponema phagedenis]QEK01514.1 flagellar biosynthesis protein FlhB [Treponema phagedenis]